MREEEKDKKNITEEQIEKLKKEIAQKGEEIEQLKKTIEELRTQIQGKEANVELGKIFEDVSELLDVGLNIFSTSGNIKGEKARSKGLFGLINDLAALAEKSETYQKRIKIGERGIVDFHVSARPIRKNYTPKSTSRLGISNLPKTTSISLQTPPTSRTVDELAVDIYDEEEDWLTVIAEIRGVKENEIVLSVDGNTLTISIDTADKKYHKKVELPSSVRKDIAESNYKNGVLEVKLQKTKNAGKTY